MLSFLSLREIQPEKATKTELGKRFKNLSKIANIKICDEKHQHGYSPYVYGGCCRICYGIKII